MHRALIKDGSFEFHTPAAAVAFQQWKRDNEGADVFIAIATAKRTDSQNRALHLYFTQVAKALNDAGLNIEQVIKNFTMELDWTPETVKEILWRTAQKRLVGKHSTRDLGKHDDITRVYEAVNRFLAKLGVEHIPFPSMPPGYADTAPTHEQHAAALQDKSRQLPH